METRPRGEREAPQRQSGLSSLHSPGHTSPRPDLRVRRGDSEEEAERGIFSDEETSRPARLDPRALPEHARLGSAPGTEGNKSETRSGQAKLLHSC